MWRLFRLSLLSACGLLASCAESEPREEPVVQREVSPAVVDIPSWIGEQIVPSERPANLPSNFAWRPSRHFGPWTEGSDFDAVQVLLDGAGATWYFNDYFERMSADKQKLYKKYYRRLFDQPIDVVQLPAGTTPELNHKPGGTPSMPPADNYIGANSVLLSLRRIRATSRYGGSLEMVFELASMPPKHEEAPHADDFEYEFAHRTASTVHPPGSVAPPASPAVTTVETVLFDTKRLAMSVFVSPDPVRFNPHLLTQGSTSAVNVEFDARQITAYRNGNRVPAAELENVLPRLYEVFASLEEPVAQASPGLTWTHAERFILGFLHDQFQNELDELTSTTDKVDRLLISDNFVDVHTREGKPAFMTLFRVSEIRSWEDSVGRDEYTMNIYNSHCYKTVTGGEFCRYVGNPLHEYEAEEPDGTPWVFLGLWLLPECSALNRVHFIVSMWEEDPFNATHFDVEAGEGFDFPKPDCTEMRVKVDSEIFGTLEVYQGVNYLYDSDDRSRGALGWMEWQRRWILTVR